jgi:hypothetical protein
VKARFWDPSTIAAAAIFGHGIAFSSPVTFECTGMSTVVDTDGPNESISQAPHKLKAVIDIDKKIQISPNGSTTPVTIKGTTVSFSASMERSYMPAGTNSVETVVKSTRSVSIETTSGAYSATARFVEMTAGKTNISDETSKGICKASAQTK